MGSRIALSGKRVSCGEFTSSARYEYKDKDEMERINNLPIKELKEVPDMDDDSKYEWYEVGRGKYDRFMYCPRTGIKRTQTMGEFYGNSTVD